MNEGNNNIGGHNQGQGPGRNGGGNNGGNSGNRANSGSQKRLVNQQGAPVFGLVRIDHLNPRVIANPSRVIADQGYHVIADQGYQDNHRVIEQDNQLNEQDGNPNENGNANGAAAGNAD